MVDRRHSPSHGTRLGNQQVSRACRAEQGVLPFLRTRSASGEGLACEGLEKTREDRPDLTIRPWFGSTRVISPSWLLQRSTSPALSRSSRGPLGRSPELPFSRFSLRSISCFLLAHHLPSSLFCNLSTKQIDPRACSGCSTEITFLLPLMLLMVLSDHNEKSPAT